MREAASTLLITLGVACLFAAAWMATKPWRHR